MKTNQILPLLAGLALSSGLAFAADSTAKASDNVSVIFQDADNFTDIRESHSDLNNTAYLNELHDYVKQTASRLLPAGAKLAVTFLDLDLAGMIRPDHDFVRVMTGVTPPRAHVKFQLLDAEGQVLKEGERRLSDMNYQHSIPLQSRSDPLGYDKQLLRDWLDREFKKTS